MTNKKPNNQPNMDLIRMVQNARMAHDQAAQPSQVAAVYWIEVKPRQVTTTPTPRAGFWRIRVTTQTVDAVWSAVKSATEAGELGYKSKVSTASRDGDPNSRVIHVLTVDADDAVDVERVRAALVKIGHTPDGYERRAEG